MQPEETVIRPWPIDAVIPLGKSMSCPSTPAIRYSPASSLAAKGTRSDGAAAERDAAGAGCSGEQPLARSAASSRSAFIG
jgi:hypothetical protein